MSEIKAPEHWSDEDVKRWKQRWDALWSGRKNKSKPMRFRKEAHLFIKRSEDGTQTYEWQGEPTAWLRMSYYLFENGEVTQRGTKLLGLPGLPFTLRWVHDEEYTSLCHIYLRADGWLWFHWLYVFLRLRLARGLFRIGRKLFDF